AKIAMAEQAIMAPTAGSGSMKKVNGTSSAMAMVAVRPGMAPTSIPKTDAMKTEMRTLGVATSPTAFSMASMGASEGDDGSARQRNAHQDDEELVDGEDGDGADQDRHPPADAQEHHAANEYQPHRDDVAELV